MTVNRGRAIALGGVTIEMISIGTVIVSVVSRC